MADEYFFSVRRPNEFTDPKEVGTVGIAVLGLGQRFFGSLEEPTVPVDLFADKSGLSIRPSKKGSIEASNILTAKKGNDDEIVPLEIPDSAQFQIVQLKRGQQLRVIGIDGTTVTIYPQFKHQ